MEHLDGYCGPEPSRIISDTLKRRSQLAPGRYPTFRVVWSENVFEKSGGEWSDWDEGVAVEDRGTLSNVLDIDGQPVPVARPIRTVVEIREVPKYTHLDPPGWILERWFPPHMISSPEAWYAHVVPGTNIPKLGPYPERGQYVMLTGPFPQEPSISFLEDFIGFHKQKSEAVLGQDVEAYIKQRVYEKERAYNEKRDKDLKESIARMQDAAKGVLLGTSLAAGRLRNRAAERIGLRSHVGN